MSTPVSVDAPLTAYLTGDTQQEEDLQSKLQQMIKLQYEEQQHVAREYYISDGRDTIDWGNTNASSLDAPPTEGINWSSSFLDPTFASPLGTPPQRSSSPNLPQHPGVGRGTLVFSNTYKATRASSNSPVHQRRRSKSPRPISAKQPSNPQPSTQPKPIGYGALSSSVKVVVPTKPSPPVQEEPPPATVHTAFNPIALYHQEQQTAAPDRSNSFSEPALSASTMCCLSAPFIRLISKERAQESFCQGAIDGLLLGSVMVTGWNALAFLRRTTPWHDRLTILAFGAAITIANAVGVAIEHVWTTYRSATWKDRERRIIQRQLRRAKGEIKAALVDHLVTVGMLQNDATYLVNALEGYPELFGNLLRGDALWAGMERSQSPATSRSNMISSGNPFASYSSLQDTAELPLSEVEMAVRKSQQASFMRLLGFSLFANVPCVFWLILPYWMSGSHTSTTHDSFTGSTSGLSVPTVVSMLSLCMGWMLGMWKSQFEPTHSLIVGLETVMCLLMGILSAYSLGYLWNAMLKQEGDL